MTEQLAGRIRVKQPGKALGYTGHRPDRLGGYNPSNPIMTYVRHKLYVETLRGIEEGFDTFVCGFAIGTDLEAAKIVLELKEHYPHIRLIAAIPFQGQELKWPQAAQEEYHHLLEQCDEVYYVSDPGYAPWKMGKRNEWIIDWPVKRLVAVFDGEDRGGTRNCLNYAKRVMHKPEIVYIDPKKYKELTN